MLLALLGLDGLPLNGLDGLPSERGEPTRTPINGRAAVRLDFSGVDINDID